MVILIAGVLTYFTLTVHGWPALDPSGLLAATLGWVTMPSDLAGIVVSGNVHQPSVIAQAGVLFLTYTAIVAAAWWVGGRLLALIRNHSRSER